MSESWAQLLGETQALFAQAGVDQWLTSLVQNCKSTVERTSEADMVQADMDAWADALADQFAVEPLRIDRDAIYLDDCGEEQVDVGGDAERRFSMHYEGPVMVPGRRVVAHIPFTGNELLLRVHGSQRFISPPRAAIGRGELTVTFVYPHDRKPAIATIVEKLLADVEQNLGWQLPDIERHNAGLREATRRMIVARRDRILADREHLGSVGIPVRKRDGAPTTFAAPGITRRQSPAPVSKRVAARPPLEPTLVNDFYAHIIGLVGSMARGMERAPGDYASWGEEQLRDALLVLLNTHYEGAATGETFNHSGKTDILVRVEDRNVFIAECKWWSGPAAFAETGREAPSALDQLLAYTTWRDAKLALVLFVRNVDMSRVTSSAREKLALHPAFEVWANAPEGELRCRVRLPGDTVRGADLAVVFVHLPRP